MVRNPSPELLVLALNLENRILIHGGNVAQHSPRHTQICRTSPRQKELRK